MAWDGEGHDFSFLSQKWKAGWHDGKAHPPAWKLVITWIALAGSGAGGSTRMYVMAHDALGAGAAPAGAGQALGETGMSSQSSVTRPAACQLMGAVCREPQLTGTPAASRDIWRSSACLLPRHTQARTLLTARTYPAAQKALAATAHPGLPAAPAVLLVCLPASAPVPLPSSLSLSFLSPLFFPLS